MSETASNTHPDLPSILPEASGSYVFEPGSGRRAGRLNRVEQPAPAADTDPTEGAANGQAPSDAG